MPATLTTSSWLFPPQTREVQFDEMWSFVGKKPKHCDPLNPDDDHKGDWWDHVAYDPQHKLVLAVVPGARVTESVEEVVGEVKDRLDGQPPDLMTSDEYPVETVIGTAFSQPVVAPQETAGPGRRPLLPQRYLDPGVTYATVHKKRQNNRVVAVDRAVVLGTQEAVDRVLKGSVCSRTINMSFVERQHATARSQNARQSRRTYRFSKDWQVHESMSYLFHAVSVQLPLAGADVAGSWRRGPLATANARNVGWVIGSYLVHGGMAELPRHSTKLRHHLSRVIRLCLRFGVSPVFMPAWEPQFNGSVENFNGWFQEPLLQRRFRRPGDLRRELARLQEAVNTQHVHPRLHGQTPSQHRRGLRLRKLLARFVVPTGRLPLAEGRVTFIRRVSVAGTVMVLSQSFRVKKRHRGLYLRLVLDTGRGRPTAYLNGRVVKRWPYKHLND